MRFRYAVILAAALAACSDSSGPSKTAPSAPVRQLTSEGNTTCAVTADSAAWCWGDLFGPKPTHWAPAYKFRYLAVGELAGPGYVCGVTGAHQTICQGTFFTGGDFGVSLGSGPTVLAADTGVDSLAASMSHFCGITSGRVAWCWGDYAAGIRGDSVIPGTRDSFTVPSRVAGGLSWAGIAAGPTHTCGLTTGRAVYCWGFAHEVGVPDSASYDTSSSHCTLGLAGGAPCSYVPLQLTTVPQAAGIVSSGAATCAITTTNTLWCWGYVGPTGANVSQVPAETPLSISVINVAVGTNGGYCVLSTAGDAYCGNLGTTPTLIAGGLRYLNISTGSDHACAIGVGGFLYCWGSNGSGQLGQGDSTTRSLPTQVVIPDSTS